MSPAVTDSRLDHGGLNDPRIACIPRADVFAMSAGRSVPSRWQYLIALVCFLACLGFGRGAIGQPARATEEPDQRELALEDRRLALERERLTFDREKYERDHALERMKALGTIGSVAVPLLLAIWAYVIQQNLRRRDEALQFQLKTAEIVMDSRDTDQARSKAALLTSLFPDRLGNLKDMLSKDKDKDKDPLPYFGPSMERREELLRMLAQYPESRGDLIRAWEILFPWSLKASWFESLKKDTTLNQNRAAPAPTAPGPSSTSAQQPAPEDG